jgi:hypothetical protein
MSVERLARPPPTVGASSPHANVRRIPTAESRRRIQRWRRRTNVRREATSPARGFQRLTSDGSAAQFLLALPTGGVPVAGSQRCRSFTALWRRETAGKTRNANRCPNEHSCAGRHMLRFGVRAANVRDQGQHQFQRRAHLPRAGTALLRQDPDQRAPRGTLVLHGARSHRCRLAKSEGLTLRNVGPSHHGLDEQMFGAE